MLQELPSHPKMTYLAKAVNSKASENDRKDRFA